jgi:hypothetical protein
MKLIPITSIYTPDKLKEFLAVYGWELKRAAVCISEQ